MATVLDYDIKFLPGVGEKRAGVLARELGIRTFGDLLYYFPFRYVDRTKLFRIGDIGPDAPAYIQVRARVTGMAYEGEGRKRRLRVFVSDGSGTADLVWFSGTKWIEKRIEAGREYIVFGRPALFRGELSFVHPEIDLVEALVNRPGGGLQGVYSTTEKLSGVQLGSKGIYKLVCAGAYYRDAAAVGSRRPRSAAAGGGAPQYPFSAVAGAAPAGGVPPQVRGAAGYPARYSVAARHPYHCSRWLLFSPRGGVF